MLLKRKRESSMWRKNEMSYLDVLVKRRNTEFVTTDFKKETFTGNYFNFQTHCG